MYQTLLQLDQKLSQLKRPAQREIYVIHLLLCHLQVARSRGQRSSKISKTAGGQKSERKTSSSKKRQRRTGGAINKTTLFGRCVSYIPICFDGIELCTGRNCTLQTAQKMQESRKSDTCFEERLQAALMASAEHGRDVEQLKLRFGVIQPAGFFLGPRFVLRSPTVRSIEEVGKLRRMMSLIILQSFPRVLFASTAEAGAEATCFGGTVLSTCKRPGNTFKGQ